MTNKETFEKVQNGYKMNLEGLECEVKWKQMMTKCWSLNPKDRPSFSALLEEIEKPTLPWMGSEPKTTNLLNEQTYPIQSAYV